MAWKNHFDFVWPLKESTIWYNLNTKLHNHFVFQTVQYMCACFRAKEILHFRNGGGAQEHVLGSPNCGGSLWRWRHFSLLPPYCFTRKLRTLLKLSLSSKAAFKQQTFSSSGSIKFLKWKFWAQINFLWSCWIKSKIWKGIIKALISTNAINTVKNTKIELISLGQLISKGLYHVK